MGINSTEVSYGFGQMGSAYTNAGSDEILPPTNKVWIAITMLEDTIFDAVNGLVAEGSYLGGDYVNPITDIYIGTDQPAHDNTAGAETTEEGSGGKVVDGVTFPKGITIYGRWRSVDVLSGAVIAYVGI